MATTTVKVTTQVGSSVHTVEVTHQDDQQNGFVSQPQWIAYLINELKAKEESNG